MLPGQGAYAPSGIRGDTERECGNFLRHEIHKDSVSSVEAGRMEDGHERRKSCA